MYGFIQISFLIVFITIDILLLKIIPRDPQKWVGSLQCAVLFLHMVMSELIISILCWCGKHGKGKTGWRGPDWYFPVLASIVI